MKIVGDRSSFIYFSQEKGLCGHNDFLEGDSFFYDSDVHDKGFHCCDRFKPVVVNGKIGVLALPIHIPKNFFSTVTGKLREYCLPFSWKKAFLDKKDDSQPQEILIYQGIKNGAIVQYSSGPKFLDYGDLPESLQNVSGKSLCLAQIIEAYPKQYRQFFRHEYFVFPEARQIEQTFYPLTRSATITMSVKGPFCPIYRRQSLRTKVTYEFLKRAFSGWKEVTLQANGLSEKILIKSEHEALFVKYGLISHPQKE